MIFISSHFMLGIQCVLTHEMNQKQISVFTRPSVPAGTCFSLVLSEGTNLTTQTVHENLLNDSCRSCGSEIQDGHKVGQK